MSLLNWDHFMQLPLLGLLISGRLIHIRSPLRTANILEVTWNILIWLRAWIMLYFIKCAVRLTRNLRLKVKQMKSPAYLRMINQCHFARQLRSQFTNGLSSSTVSSSRMRCFFLAEWLLSLTWRTSFLMTFLLRCIEVKLSVLFQRKW